MSLNVTGLRAAIISHAMTSGRFDQVNGHEPKSAPGNGLSCEFWTSLIRPAPEHSGLIAATALVVFNVRIRLSMTYEPQDDIDDIVLSAVDAMMNEYAGDFELGSTLSVKCVDLLGMSGVALTTDFGYLNQDNKLYRVATITLPLIVNDAWSEAA